MGNILDIPQLKEGSPLENLMTLKRAEGKDKACLLYTSIITNTNLNTGTETSARADKRAFDELRNLKIEAGVLERADGSAYLEMGGNKVLAAVYGPRELFVRRLMQPNRAVLRCNYNMAPFSVDDRKRPGPDRRSVEISKITSDALSPAVFLEKFPRSTIDVYKMCIRDRNRS